MHAKKIAEVSLNTDDKLTEHESQGPHLLLTTLVFVTFTCSTKLLDELGTDMWIRSDIHHELPIEFWIAAAVAEEAAHRRSVVREVAKCYSAAVPDLVVLRLEVPH